MPVGLAVFFGLFTFRRMTPLAFRCLRCGAEFQRKPWRRFPAACPACHAKDWSAP
jgi:Zn finger protein HypA/HybF involved in hydrogenase expression